MHAEQVDVLKLSQARLRFEERCGQIERDLDEIERGDEAERDRLMRSETELERSREMAELQRGRLDAAESVRRERDNTLRETRALEQALARELQEARHSERECRSKLESNQCAKVSDSQPCTDSSRKYDQGKASACIDDLKRASCETIRGGTFTSGNWNTPQTRYTLVGMRLLLEAEDDSGRH